MFVLELFPSFTNLLKDYRATGGVTGDNNYGNDSSTSTYGHGSRSTNEDPYGSNVSNKQDSGVDGDIGTGPSRNR